MNIGIVTDTLESNYGGILQNYALQQVLLSMGHNPITIDYHPRNILQLLRYNLKSILYLPFPNKRRPFKLNSYIHDKFKSFAKNIIMTEYCTRLNHRVVDKYSFDAIIVGSDQVWRPKYVANVDDMYLSFVSDEKIKKIAYAASFGTNQWEYTRCQTKRCKKLVANFDSVSVREFSGVELCRRYYNIKVEKVMDPTLLLTADDYNKLVVASCPNKEKYLLAYLLDKTADQIKVIELIALEYNLKIVSIGAHDEVSITVERWLELIKNASYVVTDSFHGTVFSIIYHHNFISFANENRGIDRFESLLKMFGLQNRIWKGDKDVIFQEIDWRPIDEIIIKEKVKSVRFLATNMED